MKKQLAPSFAVSLALLAAWCGWALAQDAGDEDQPDQQSIPVQPEPASASPGEDIMQPTRHGVRFTRRMAEGFGRMLVTEEFGEGFWLEESQKEQLAKAFTDRAWQLKLENSPAGAEAIEYFYEMLIAQEMSREKELTPELAREFSSRVGPGVKLVRQFWESVRDDARPILSDEQFAGFDEKAEDILRMTSRFEEHLGRWSRGEVKEGERISDAFQKLDDAEWEPRHGKSKAYLQAERSARSRINRLGPDEWRRFLRQAGKTLEFDESQRKAGEDLLRHYSDQAKAIMNSEWRARALANQVQRQLQWMAHEEPLEPWIYHLDLEYRDLVKPLMDMGRSFRSEVLGLARSEQRDLLLADLRKLALEHGMSEADADLQFLAALAQPVEVVGGPEEQAAGNAAQSEMQARSAGEGEPEPDAPAK